MRNKKKEILAIWEDFDKKYNFTNFFKSYRGGNNAKILITVEMVDDYFDMKDKMETAFPKVIKTQYWESTANYFEKYYDFSDTKYGNYQRRNTQSYLWNTTKGMIKSLKENIHKIKE